MNLKVSVIVPVYNVEKYLSQCLDALIHQTLRDIEIICVDDGSTDKSAKIVQEYIKKDHRIHYIYQRNQGLAAARNTGIKFSKAPYLMFCDSDDWYDKRMCEKMYHAITQNDVDFACCGIKMEYEIANPTSKEADKKYYRIKFDGVQEITQKTWENIDASSCNKIFKRELLDSYNLRYPNGLHYEDFCFFLQLLAISKKMYCIPEYLYHYRRRDGSIMTETFSAKSTKALDHIKILWIIHHFLIKNNLWESWKKTFYTVFLIYFDLAYKYLSKNKQYLTYKEVIPFMKRVTQEDLSLLTADQKQTWHDILNRNYSGAYVRRIKIAGISLIKIRKKNFKYSFSVLGLRVFSKKRKKNKEKFYILYIPVWKRKIKNA